MKVKWFVGYCVSRNGVSLSAANSRILSLSLQRFFRRSRLRSVRFFLSLASPSRETITFLHFFSYYDFSFLRFMVTRYCLPLLFVTFYSYFYPPPLTMCHVLELGQRTWNKLLGDNQFFDPMVELQLSNKI